MERKFQHLTPDQIRSFMERGFLRLEKCFTSEQAASWTGDVWTRLGFDSNAKSTWKTERTNMPSHKSIPVSEFAPKAWAAICELCGGEDRVASRSNSWSDALIINLGTPEFEGKIVHPKDLDGWHVDGDFFVHFLDSPEQALLVIPLYTDIQKHAGGTTICSDGIGKIARWLQTHPEGVSPRMVPRGQPAQHKGLGFYSELIQSCSDFHEMTGKAGDVILMHPLMVHSASRNSLRLPRIITNPPVSLKEPFNFDRKDAAEYSLVELKTLRELGPETLKGWKITGTRDTIIPERIKIQNRMKEEELKRLEAQNLKTTQELRLGA